VNTSGSLNGAQVELSQLVGHEIFYIYCQALISSSVFTLLPEKKYSIDKYDIDMISKNDEMCV